MRSSSSVVTPGTTCSPIMSSTSAASCPATRIFSCSSGVLMVTCIGSEMGSAATCAKGYRRARKTLFRRGLHGIKRGLFWQRNHTRASLTPATGCPANDPPLEAFRDGHGDVRRLNPEGVLHARRVHATDAGGGSPFRTSDPLLEPEDGAVHLRRAEQDPHHQSREDAADVLGRCELHQGCHCRWRHGAVRRYQALRARVDPEGG